MVDDLHGNLIALEALLRDEPVALHRAQSGTEALELLLTHEFAVALIDVQMPGMSGFELAEIMRGTESTRSIPIIFITAGSHDPGRIFQGYEAGAVDFLIKPLDPFIVRSKVRVFVEMENQKRQLRQAHAELEKALQARDEFMSIASHELRTPLTPLKLQVDFLKRMAEQSELADYPGESIQRMLSISQRQVSQLQRLIDDLLDSARIAEGRLPINRSETDLTQLVHNVLEQFGEQLKEAGCPIEIDTQPGLVGNWDRGRIEQVIINLLSNACKYAAGSHITVHARRRDSVAQLVVADGGAGIPPEHLPHVFDRLSRVDSKASMAGLGLGLYITREIVSMHAGDITVDSTVDSGTTFTVTLPLINVHEPAAVRQ